MDGEDLYQTLMFSPIIYFGSGETRLADPECRRIVMAILGSNGTATMLALLGQWRLCR